ncbi:hypothetical protein F2Q70_00016766 [Brassica cretica]|uniref:Uncharacterized protein n=1 Tax=Brassica cretica TaxID=69181 RepID=A0A8S9I0X5_BRACR|nr:hypothetical protein F2Q70_00016766 [Brassica cretica]
MSGWPSLICVQNSSGNLLTLAVRAREEGKLADDKRAASSDWVLRRGPPRCLSFTSDRIWATYALPSGCARAPIV